MDKDKSTADASNTMYSVSMLHMAIGSKDISYVFMSRNKKFVLEIIAESLEGEGGLVEEFYKFNENIDDPDTFRAFQAWAINPIHERLFRELVPTAVSKPTTLLDYYDPPTYVFELYNDGGILKAKELPSDHDVSGQPSYKIDIVVDEDPTLPGGGFIYRSTLPTVPFIPASHLVRAASLDSMEEHMCEVPGIVRNIHTEEKLLFKAAIQGRNFRREVEILAKLKSISAHDDGLRTSRIVGLVNWDGQESVLMGMLLEIIEGRTLYDSMRDASVEEKSKWIDQIEETVRRLHRHGIVWGDVKPDNVIINSCGNAFVCNFSGGFTREYVDVELSETKEGDLQGLWRIRTKLFAQQATHA